MKILQQQGLFVGLVVLLLSNIGYASSYRWHGRLMAGFNLYNPRTINYNNYSGRVEYHTGYQLAGGIDYDIKPIILEVEFNHLHNGIQQVTDGSVANTAWYDATATGLFGNIYLPFPIYEARFVPYLGFGVGSLHVRERDRVTSMQNVYNVDDTVFAYQTMVGFGVRVTPRIAINADYRFMATGTVDYVRLTDNAQIDRVHWYSHSLNLSFVYSLM